MKIIGLTGGIGSGKSTIANIIKDKYHGHILIADDFGHFAMQIGKEPYNKIVDLFGVEILMENKEIDRSKLSEIVFQDKNQLEKLNAIIHPFVHKSILMKIDEIQKKEKEALIVIESAILIEAGYTEMCDEIWYVYSSEEIRKRRLKENRGYTDDKISAIMEKQLKEESFCEKSTKTISNNGDIHEIYQQLENLLV